MKLAGADPDFHRRDLWEAIEAGAFPEWDLAVQTFDQDLAETLPYDILDATKLIPEEHVPLQVVGRMVLDRNPDNFFAETEQVAFLPTNIVPGIDFSDDPLLQGRLFSYLDTQGSRLGTTNFHQIPINAPKCPVANFQRDGRMQTLVPTGRANYEPNSLDLAGQNPGPRPSTAGFTTYPETPDGPKMRVRSERFADHYSQARMFLRSQTPVEQTHIVSAIVFELSKVTLAHIRTRVLANLVNVDSGLAGRVAAGLGCPVPEASPTTSEPIDLDLSLSLSIVNKAKPTLTGRKVGIVFTDGSPSAGITKLAAAVRAAGATPMLIAPRRLDVATEPTAMDAHGQLAGTPSVTCDAIAIVVTEAGAAALAADPVAVQFVADAYAHLKAIGHTEAATALQRASDPITALSTSAPTSSLRPASATTSERPRRTGSRDPGVRPGRRPVRGCPHDRGASRKGGYSVTILRPWSVGPV